VGAHPNQSSTRLVLFTHKHTHTQLTHTHSYTHTHHTLHTHSHILTPTHTHTHTHTHTRIHTYTQEEHGSEEPEQPGSARGIKRGAPEDEDLQDAGVCMQMRVRGWNVCVYMCLRGGGGVDKGVGV